MQQQNTIQLTDVLTQTLTNTITPEEQQDAKEIRLRRDAIAYKLCIILDTIPYEDRRRHDIDLHYPKLLLSEKPEINELVEQLFQIHLQQQVLIVEARLKQMVYARERSASKR